METELSRLENWTSQIYSIFFTDPSDRVTLSTRLPALSFARGKFCHGSALVLVSSMVRAPAYKAGDPGSSPSPGWNFSLSIL